MNAELITALVGVLGALGAAARFVWNKLERRFTEIEAKLEECHKREQDSQHRRGILNLAIELLWQEVERLAPKSRALGRVRKHLDELKTLTPPET